MRLDYKTGISNFPLLKGWIINLVVKITAFEANTKYGEEGCLAPEKLRVTLYDRKNSGKAR